MVATPEYKRGDPAAGPMSQPLQKGDAKKLNDAVDMIPDGPPQGVDLSGQQKAAQQETFSPQDDNKRFILGPSTRPWQHVGQEAPQKRPAPADAQKWLPLLLEASADPSAPEELHTLVRILSRSLEDY